MLETRCPSLRVNYQIPLIQRVAAAPRAPRSCTLRSFSAGEIPRRCAHAGRAAFEYRWIRIPGADAPGQGVPLLASAKRTLEQRTLASVRWKNQIRGRQPSVVSSAVIKNVIGITRSLYKGGIGIGLIIHVHDAAAAIHKKNNRSFATPDAALRPSTPPVNCYVLCPSGISE